MRESKRLNFLKSFLKLYGVEKIELIEENENSISGFAIYNNSNLEEKQEFIWHKSEDEVPSPELKILIEKIVSEKLHYGDKVIDEIENIELPEFDNQMKEKLIDQLYDIEIKMIDNGEETDSFFVHD
ncbi:MAG: hypothetical protein H6571_09235 [Lewinellaceae bacterium]|nr:hypothetical protein [Bacteroidota bacterium]MCB9323902.1 hypothetical protein [Lewinellaceae bacterium]